MGKITNRLNSIVKYFLQLKIKIRLRTRIKVFYFKKRLIKLHNKTGVIIDLDNNSSNNISNLSIDVFIPAIERDVEILQYGIDSIRKNILHPIDNIYIAGPRSKGLLNLCKIKNCTFIDENKIIPLKKEQINYKTKRSDRSGWIFQQLLKLNCDTICANEFILIADADTIFVRPQCFEHKNKIIFDSSTELHLPYFDIYTRLLGNKPDYLVSFVAHHMLFKKDILKFIKQNIETIHGNSWFNVILNLIDKNEDSGFSEYELYGHYMLCNFKNEIIIEPWKNLIIKRNKLSKTSSKSYLFSKKYKTITYPHYY